MMMGVLLLLILLSCIVGIGLLLSYYRTTQRLEISSREQVLLWEPRTRPLPDGGWEVGIHHPRLGAHEQRRFTPLEASALDFGSELQTQESEADLLAEQLNQGLLRQARARNKQRQLRH